MYDFLLVINTNVPCILHRKNRCIFATPLGFNSPDVGVLLGRCP